MNRLKYIDWVKGTGMLFVIYGHVITGISNDFQIWFYSFHVPIFFFISGYLLFHSYNKKKEMDYDIKKNAKTLLLPYVTFSIFNIIVQTIRNVIIDNDVILKFKNQTKRMFVLQGVTATWFLISLFIVIVMFKFLFKTFKDKKHIIITAVILASIPFLFTKTYGEPSKMLYKSFIALFYFTVGFFSYKHVERKSISWWLIVLLFGLSIVYSRLLGSTNLQEYIIKEPVLYFISGLLGSFAFLTLFKKMETYNLKFKPLTYIGKNSLIYLGTHMSVIAFLEMAYTKAFINKYILDWKIKGIAITIATSIIGVLIVNVFNNYLYILIGKKRPIKE